MPSSDINIAYPSNNLAALKYGFDPAQQLDKKRTSFIDLRNQKKQVALYSKISTNFIIVLHTVFHSSSLYLS